jgi:hypothetical protein
MTTSMRSGVEHGGEAVARRPEFSWLARAGLGGYAVWRLVRAGIGHGTQDEDNGWARVAGVASGVAYAALCVTAVKILIGASSSGGSSSPKRTTSPTPTIPAATQRAPAEGQRPTRAVRSRASPRGRGRRPPPDGHRRRGVGHT